MTNKMQMKVELTIIGATDLLIGDLNGLSDPYVKFKISGKKYKTDIIYETLNPYWSKTLTLILDKGTISSFTKTTFICFLDFFNLSS